MPRDTHCDGVRDQSLRITGFRNWTQLRDEIAPAFRRQFPGVLVIVDERVVVSSIPDPEWHGASLTMLGLDLSIADYIANTLAREISWELGESAVIDNVTAAEADQIAAHRADANGG